MNPWIFVVIMIILGAMGIAKVSIGTYQDHKALCEQAGGVLVQGSFGGDVCVQPIVPAEPKKQVLG